MTYLFFPNNEDMSEIHDSLSNIAISVQDVYVALISLDVKKSPGMDRISPRVLKNCAEALCEPLHHLFTHAITVLCFVSSLLENS